MNSTARYTTLALGLVMVAVTAAQGFDSTARGQNTDSDGDGITNALDNCALQANPAQRDTDGDDIGNFCDPDFDNDGLVDFSDLSFLKNRFFGSDELADLDGDGVVNFADLRITKDLFFGPPGPSGLVLTRIAVSSPRDGEHDVATTRETIVEFDAPIDPATVNAASIAATYAGQPLAATYHVSPDMRRVTLFYDPPLPPSALVRVTVDGDALIDSAFNTVDADGNGLPGGVAEIDFRTLNLTTVLGTSVCGRVFASELNVAANGMAMDTPLAGVTITVDGRENDLFTTTDADGNFCLTPAPAGRFFVHIDGRTASNGVPPGAYYPFVGKAWESTAGEQSNVGDVYLPLVVNDTLQQVSQAVDTTIEFPASVLSDFPELAGASLLVPADSLYADDGTRGGEVGIAPVAPDRLPGQLPPGLNLPLVVTVQTDGATNFDTPAPLCLPNLPDPVSGLQQPAGAETALWSFNHDTGRFEVIGPAMVDGSGDMVCTAPGVGVTAPGWHGFFPGVFDWLDRWWNGPELMNKEDAVQILHEDYLDKQDTTDAALAHQLWCISRETCTDLWGQDGDPETERFWDQTFIDLANNRTGFSSTLREIFIEQPLLDIACSDPVLDLTELSVRDCRLLIDGGKHFVFDLATTYARHCELFDDEQVVISHNEFLDNGVGNCFNEVHAADEAGAFTGDFSTVFTAVAARALRLAVVAACPTLQGNLFRDDIPPLDDLLAPPDLIELINSLISDSQELAIDNTGATVLIGEDVQIDVSDSDGRRYAGGDLQYMVFAPPGIATVSADGVLSAHGSYNPHPDFPTPVVVAVATPAGYGLGLFAIHGTDTDGDQINDFWEQLRGLDPLVPNDTDADADRDGLADVAEIYLMLDPLAKDSDGDGLEDLVELGDGLDPWIGDTLDSLVTGANSVYYVLENRDTGVLLRGQSSELGAIASLNLAPRSVYRAVILDPRTLSVGEAWFETPAAGRRQAIPEIVVAADTSGDSDGDGLGDTGEFVVGTNLLVADTDTDGIGDGAELLNGTNPLDGLIVRTGIIAAVETPGLAWDVDARNDLVAIAGGDAGMTLFNVFERMNPTAIAQIDTPGVATAVALAGDFVAVADGDAGLAIVDVSDPPAAQILHQLTPATIGGPGRAVVADSDRVYVAAGSRITAIELAAGLVADSIQLGEQIDDLRIAGDTLYALTGASLKTLPLGAPLAVLGSVGVSGTTPLTGRKRLFVGGGIAYVAHRDGYRSYDVSDALNPAFLADSGNQGNGWKQFVVNGSGLGIAAASPNPTLNPDGNVWLFDATDPSSLGNFLTQFQTPGAAVAIALFNGLAYVADYNGGLQVINYLAYDALGVAPSVAFTTNPGGPTVEEYSRLIVDVSVTDDVQVGRVELLADGVVIDSDGNYPYQFAYVVPSLAVTSAVELSVRAIDTGGNAGVSAPQTLMLTPDLSGPSGASSAPRHEGVGFDIDAVHLTFSERIDPTLVDLAGFTLLALGADGLPGGGDDMSVPLAAFTVSANQRHITLTTATPLTPGNYQLTVSPVAIVDLAGNAMTAPLVVFFTSYPTPPPNTVYWSTFGDGDWLDPANWHTGLVPPVDATAIIDRGGIELTVRVAGAVGIGGLLCHENLYVDSGSMTLTSQGIVSGTLTADPGTSLTASGDVAMVRALGPADIDGMNLYANTGGELHINQASTYIGRNGNFNDTTMRASGAGSVISLPAVALIRSGDGIGTDLRVQALDGARLNLGGAVELATAPGGFPGETHAFLMLADGEGSFIDLAAAQSFIDTANTRASALTVRNGAGVSMPQLATFDGVTLSWDGSGSFDSTQILVLRRGGATADSFAFDLGNVTDISTSSFTLQNGGTMDLASAASIDGASFFVNDGVVLSLPSATSYTGRSRTTSTFRASGAGSLLDLSALGSVSSGGGIGAQHVIEALAGGTVDLGGAVELRTVSGGFPGETHPLRIRADGAGSTVYLTAAESFADSSDRTASTVTVANEGTVVMPALSELSGVTLSWDGTGTLPTTQIASLTGGGASADGVFFDFGNAIDVSRSSFTLSNGGAMDLGNATTIDGASFFVNDGLTLALPAATSYVGRNGATSTFRANGAGSLLDLSALQTLSSGGGIGAAHRVEALAGGFVDLSGVTNLLTSPGGLPGETHPLVLAADGASSVIDISTALTFADTSDRRASRIEVSAGGTILMDMLAELDGVTLTWDGTGSLPSAQITGLRHGGLTADGVHLDLVSAADIRGSTFTLGNGGSLDLSAASLIDGASFIVNDGLTLALPAATSYVGPGGRGATFRASGTGSLLDLSGLVSVSSGGGIGARLDIQAQSGGLVDLGSVTTLATSPGGLPGETHPVAVLADGSDSLVALTALDSFTDSSNSQVSTLTAQNDGLVGLGGGVVSLSGGVTAKLTSGGSFTGGTLDLGAGSKLDGNGVLPMHVVNRSTVRPSFDAAGLTVDGDYTQEPAGTLFVELGGLLQGQEYDWLRITGMANLNGVLDVTLSGGFVPLPGDGFTVLDFGSRSGSFDSLDGLDLGGGLILVPVFNPGDLTLQTQSP